MYFHKLKLPVRLRGGMHSEDPDAPLKAITSELQVLRTNHDPGQYPIAPPDRQVDDKNEFTPEYKVWYYEWDMWRRGLKDPGQEQPNTYNRLYDDIYNKLKTHGLDVILEMQHLPEPIETLMDLEKQDSIFWTHYNWNLIQIITRPGPLFLTFIASTFQDNPDHYHIWLCYRSELIQWFKHLCRMHGKIYAINKMREWFNAYNTLRSIYNGKRARIRGHITSGFTVQVGESTQVDGTPPNHQLFDGGSYDTGRGDRLLRFVHRLPGGWFDGSSKSQQDLHVSLLND